MISFGRGRGEWDGLAAEPFDGRPLRPFPAAFPLFLFYCWGGRCRLDISAFNIPFEDDIISLKLKNTGSCFFWEGLALLHRQAGFFLNQNPLFFIQNPRRKPRAQPVICVRRPNSCRHNLPPDEFIQRGGGQLIFIMIGYDCGLRRGAKMGIHCHRAGQRLPCDF